MELHQVRYFIAVMENDGFSGGARRLRIAQSALSRQIGLLEDELGCRLFHRHGRGASPTPEGRSFYAAIKPVFDGLEQARNDMRSQTSVLPQRLTLAMGLTFSSAIGAAVLGRFRTRFPQVFLRLQILGGPLDLMSGEVDMAVAGYNRALPGLRSMPLLRADLFLIGAEDDLARLSTDGETVAARRLSERPLILVGTSLGLRREIELMAESTGTRLDVALETNSMDSLIDLLGAGIGLTILPHGAMRAGPSPVAIGRRRIVEPAFLQDFWVTYRSHRQRTLVMRELEAVIREETARALAEGRLQGQLPAGAPDPGAGTWN